MQLPTTKTGLGRLGGCALACAAIGIGLGAHLATTQPAQAFPPLPALNAEIGGRVTHIKNGAPLAGMEVTVLQKGMIVGQARTDADGQFYFPGLRPGTFTVSVEGGQTRTLNIGVFAVFVELTVG